MGTTERGAQRPCWEFVHKTWSADPCHLAAVRAEARHFFAPLALTEGARQDLVLAVSEAATNAIEHAYMPVLAGDIVELTFWTEPHTVFIEVMDHGRWLAPSHRPTGRGRGIAIMQRLVWSVLIHFDAHGTRVLLSHPLSGEARAEGLPPTHIAARGTFRGGRRRAGTDGHQ